MISWKLKAQNHLPIGLDIGHDSIKMIQLAVNGERISVHAADKVYVDNNINGDKQARRSFVVSTIRQMLAKNDFHGRDVVSCLNGEQLRMTNLRLAETETSEIEQAVRNEVSQRFGMDPDKDAVDYLIVGDVHQGDEIKSELILFVTDKDSIDSHIGLLEEVGLKPVAIDTVPGALFRSFERTLRRQGDKEKTAVFIDVGGQFTTVVFGRATEISFAKQIPIGGEKFDRQIATRLGVEIDQARSLRMKLRSEKSADVQSDCHAADQADLDTSTRQAIADAVGIVAEELAREIALCFRYYTVTFRGKRVERAVFAGGGSYENILMNILRRQLPAEIELAQPLKSFDMANVHFESDRRSLLSEWSVAVGLGLKGLAVENYERN